MAVAQKATSRGVSETDSPNFDLNHCRSSSTSEISAIGVLQMNDASKTRSSKACSGSVSRIAYLCRAATRAGSFFIGLGAIINLPQACRIFVRISLLGARPLTTYTLLRCIAKLCSRFLTVEPYREVFAVGE